MTFLITHCGQEADYFATLCVDRTFPPDAPEPRDHLDLSEVLALFEQFTGSELVLMHVGHKLDRWLADRPYALPHGVLLAHDGDIVDCVGV